MTNTASAQIVLNGLNYGVVTTTTTNWQTNTISFIATQAGTPLEVDSLGGSPGLLLDTFTLIDKGGPYEVLPEQPMDVLVGTNALGPWQLEVWDNRVGATNPSPTLVSWQLSFIFQNTLPVPVGLQHGATQCGTVNAGQTQYFTVAVPGWARFATNWLISADAPVNLLFNQTGKPTGTNGPGDFTLLANSTTGLVPLSAGTTPPLLPGATYYLGIQNTNTNSVAYCLQVDFDVPALTLNVPVTSCLAAGPLPQYFSYDVTTNETGVEFQLLNLTGNADLVISTNPFPTLANNDYQSVNPGTNNEQITVLTNSAPVPLSPGRWYVGVFNSDVTPVCYTVLVTDLTNTLSGVITLTNGVPYAAVNPGSSNPAYDYYRYVVSASAVRAQFEINGPTANVDLVAHQGLPLPDLTTNQFSSINSGASDQLITVFNSSSPVALAPGEWFLTAVNASGSPASYSIKASDWPLSGTNISLMSAPVSSANGFCFSWASLPGAHYYIQAKVNLTDAVWVTIQPVVTATNVTTTWCISLPSPYHFFRVEEEFVPLSGVASPVGDFTLGRSAGVMRLQWIALANKKFQVQWTPTLSPSNWKPLGSVTSSAGGLVSVTDDGSQTGGLGPMRFYRIQVVP
jgi:hypothetical protein